jgi:glucose 1-dehydrogenase
VRGLTGKRVLVTGGATGIGEATVRRFAEEGASVAINTVGGTDDAERMAEELGAACPKAVFVVVAADVSAETAVEGLFATAIERLGGLDILVNNAGIKLADRQPHEMVMAEFDRVVAVNLRGAFLCAKQAIRHFLKAGQPGVIVTTSSIHQVVPVQEDSAYAISKAGLGNMTKSLALAYARNDIRVVGVGPGAIMTPMNADLAAGSQARQEVETSIPMGRIAAPAEIAGLIAFLSSDDASYITGQTIYADGGLMIARP